MTIRSAFLPLAGFILILAMEPYAAATGPIELTLTNPSSQPLSGSPITLGHPFRKGDIPAGKTVGIVSMAGGWARLQSDDKSHYADGSLRHAVLTFLIDSLPPGGRALVRLGPVDTGKAAAPLSLADFLKTPFDASISLKVGGSAFSGSARAALSASGSGPIRWLSGPLCSEWVVPVPLKGASGDAHPHLAGIMAVRAYAGFKDVRVDFTVENDWAYEPNPSGFTYDAELSIDGKPVYAKAGLAHSHHARWRRVFWDGVPAAPSGASPAAEWSHDPAYWLSTGLFPYYDRSVKIAASALSALKPAFDPMSNGNLTSYMPETGAHSDIGPLPDFAALYLISADPRARRAVAANGECGGSYAIHYRDKAKGLPVSLDDYPYMTLLGNPSDTRNPKTGKNESFPPVTGGLDSLVPDDAHQPSIGYLPYIATGDYFFLEELHFWAGYNMLMANPTYRDFSDGLLKWSQVRGQAWSLRTLGHAAAITPDSHPLKAYFNEKLRHNVDWYVLQGIGEGNANALGWLNTGGALAYEPYGIAPWQDDFFTWSAAHLVALDFEYARPLALWKGKFPVGRMADTGYCWLQASAYSLQVGPADKSRFYATFGEVYRANFPAKACAGASMDGYPESPTGYGGNMQPALASAVDLGVAGAEDAWKTYQTRNPRQDFSSAPQFAVVPRTESLSGASLRPPRPSMAGFRPGAVPARAGQSFAYQVVARASIRAERYDARGRLAGMEDLGAREAGSYAYRMDREAGPGPFWLMLRAVDGSVKESVLPISARKLP